MWRFAHVTLRVCENIRFWKRSLKHKACGMKNTKHEIRNTRYKCENVALRSCGNVEREIELRIRNDCNFVTCNEKMWKCAPSAMWRLRRMWNIRFWKKL